MVNQYLIMFDNLPAGIFTWEKMIHRFPALALSKDSFKDNQWLTSDANGSKVKIIQVMVNQDMPQM